MDFHSLTRKDLQSLCKLNKIPANKTNVAMADALQSLDLVEGIEKFFNVSQSDTVELDESKENLEVSPPKVAATRCRTTRPKVKTTESEILQPTCIRTTRRTAKKLNGEVIESKNEVLETPALSSTRRKALATSSCRNVNSQLNDCELEENGDQEMTAAVVNKSRRKVAANSTTVKKQSTVQKVYGTRRSTRQTENKSGEPRMRKESEKAVEINTMLDEMNVASDEVLKVEDAESTLNAGNQSAEVEDICNAFEELDVVEAVIISEEKEKISEVDKLNPKSDEISIQHDKGDLEVEQNNVKPETDDISNPCESGDLEQEKHESEVKSMWDEVNVASDDVLKVEDAESTVNAENPNAEDSGEVDKLNPKSDEISYQHEEGDLEVEVELNNVISETDDVLNPCESGDLEQEKLESEVKVLEEHPDIILDDNSDTESVEEKEDSGEDDKPNPKSDEISNQQEEGETDDISNPCESGTLEEEKLESEVKVLEEHPDCLLYGNSYTESGVAGGECIEVDVIPDNDEKSNGSPELEEEAVSEMNNGVAGGDCIEVDVIPDNTENSNVQLVLGEEAVSEKNNGFSSMDSGMVLDNIENSNKFLNSENENDSFPVEESTNGIKEVSEIMVDETLDVIPAIDSVAPIIEEVEILQPEALSENGDALKGSTIEEEKQSSPIASTLFDLIGHPTHVTPISRSSSKNDMVKTPGFSSTHATVVTNSLRKEDNTSTTMKKEFNLQEGFSSGGSTRLTEKKFSESRVKKETEKSVKIDLMIDESNVTSEEVLPVDVLEKSMDAGNPDAKMEDVCDYGNLEEEDMFCAESEIDYVPVSNGPSTMVNSMILDDTKATKDTLKSDSVNNFNPYEENTMDNQEGSDEALDVISNIDFSKPDVSTGNSEADSVEETSQSSHNQSSILIDGIGVPTPMKKMSSCVSDDKENNGIVFANKTKKEKTRSLQDLSMRQLKKQLQAFTLKINANNADFKEQEATTARPALQPLCENQLVGGETKN